MKAGSNPWLATGAAGGGIAALPPTPKEAEGLDPTPKDAVVVVPPPMPKEALGPPTPNDAPPPPAAAAAMPLGFASFLQASSDAFMILS